MQANSTRLDHVLLTLGLLYKKYADPSIEVEVRDGIHRSLESRWAKNADHDVFIMAVFLNPFICSRVFRKGNPALVPLALYNMACRAFTRMFQQPPDTGFHSAFWDDHHEQREFSRERMALNKWKDAYSEQVRRNFSYTTTTMSHRRI